MEDKDDKIGNLAHMPFDKDLDNGENLRLTNCDITLSQNKIDSPVTMSIKINLPGSKVGGAPIKVGGAPVKVGGASLLI